MNKPNWFNQVREAAGAWAERAVQLQTELPIWLVEQIEEAKRRNQSDYDQGQIDAYEAVCNWLRAFYRK